MVEVLRYYCDMCGELVQGKHRPRVVAHSMRVTDEAGSMDTEQKLVDLCGECARRLLSDILSETRSVERVRAIVLAYAESARKEATG